MWPYWLLFGICVAIALGGGKLPESQSRWVWRLGILALAIMMGFRHEVGGDWYRYDLQFNYLAYSPLLNVVADAKDPGYSIIGWLFAKAGLSVHWLNFVCALPLAFGTVELARRQPRPMLAVMAAVPYLLIVVGMGYTRQAAAIGCAMLGLAALGQRRQLGFVTWVLVAALFHKTAILLLPVAALAATRNRIWSYFWVGILTLVGGWLFLFETVDTLVENYVLSEYADDSQGAAIRVMMNAVPSIVLLIWSKRMFKEEGERRLWVWLAVISLLCLPLLQVSATGVDRMALYLIPLQLVAFSRLPGIANSVTGRTTIVLCIVLYYSAVQFVWLNFASHADSWVPYRFIPLW